MNYTETFNDFAAKATSLDLALYAGAGLILWVIFKDRLSPVQKVILDAINKFKNNQNQLPVIEPITIPSKKESEDVFFKLVASWKQTRDLAVKSGCSEAVKVADQMFPFLSPTVCSQDTGKTS